MMELETKIIELDTKTMELRTKIYTPPYYYYYAENGKISSDVLIQH